MMAMAILNAFGKYSIQKSLYPLQSLNILFVQIKK